MCGKGMIFGDREINKSEFNLKTMNINDVDKYVIWYDDKVSSTDRIC